MGDGSSGNIGGILFEAGKTIGDAAKKQAQQMANTAAAQVTGSSKPLFGGQNSATSGTFTPKPAGQGTGQMPKLDPLSNFGNMFEGGKFGGFGAKKPAPVSNQPKFSQADLDAMAAQNKAIDEQEIVKRQAELEQIKMQKHQQLHDEVYYDQIKNAGQNSIAQKRKEDERVRQQEEEQKQQEAQAAQQQEQNILPGGPLAQNQQLPNPVVQRAMTQAETNRGTSG